VRLLARISLAFSLLALPMSAAAVAETVWDFRGGNLPGTWSIAGIDTPAALPEGLHITASATNGSLLSEIDLPHAIDTMTLTVRNAKETEVQFLWHERGNPPGMLVELPFIVPAGNGEQTFTINLEAYQQWDRRADKIGFTVPQGTDLILQEIRFSHWNLFEKAGEIWKTFWMFDRFSSFSINFVWGPVIAMSPVGTQNMFTTLPPQGRSGNWIYYAVLLCAGAAITLHARFSRFAAPSWIARLSTARLSGYTVLFLLCGAGVWLVSDIRMGLELLSYASHDYTSYITQQPGKRSLRTYLNFNDVMERSLPHLQSQRQFGFLTSPRMPVISMVRYFSYPSIPIVPEGPRTDIKAWLIFDRSDVTVDTDGRLLIQGKPWSAPGSIVEMLDADSFVFRTSP
jgi:hypothetical protein